MTIDRRLLLMPLLCAPVGLPAQPYPGYPGTHLTVDVRVVSLVHGGDSVRVSYALSNRRTSEEKLFDFNVQALTPARGLSAPPARRPWALSNRMGDESIAGWTVMDSTVMRPGHTSQPLSFTADGLPGIVNARVSGWHEPPDIDEMAEDDPRQTSRAIEVTSVPLKVVGVVPPLVNPTRHALITRLADLARQTCALGWTTDRQLCAALDAHLRMPSPQLLVFLGTVAAARARPGALNDNAYWLLRANAEIIRDFVDIPGIRLTYLCGNTFRVVNPNFVPVTVRYEVDGASEGASITLPPLLAADPQPSKLITTTAAAGVRLLYDGTAIQRAANGRVPCR
jgi:hypothetical protein